MSDSPVVHPQERIHFIITISAEIPQGVDLDDVCLAYDEATNELKIISKHNLMWPRKILDMDISEAIKDV